MRFLQWLKLREAHTDDQGYWVGDVGEGGISASGILPICANTRRLCLALRSRNVHNVVNGDKHYYGECWGIIGGAVSGDPLESAKAETHEETGF